MKSIKKSLIGKVSKALHKAGFSKEQRSEGNGQK